MVTGGSPAVDRSVVAVTAELVGRALPDLEEAFEVRLHHGDQITDQEELISFFGMGTAPHSKSSMSLL